MQSSAALQRISWVGEKGLRELELLFRAVLYHPSEPILIADSDRRYVDANSGAARLLGLPKDEIIGRRVDDFAEPVFRLQLPRLWQIFLERGEQEGTFPLMLRNGVVRPVSYFARGSVLPERHLVVLRDRVTGSPDEAPGPSWMTDYGFCLLDPDGRVVGWYAGAERIYGYRKDEIVDLHVSCLNAGEDEVRVRVQKELNRAAAEGHLGSEDWQIRKDGSRLWANVLTMALKDDTGELQGYARLMRDFSGRHRSDMTWQTKASRIDCTATPPMVPGIVCGEFDRITEVSDAFLEMVGYTREELMAGHPSWSDLTPTTYWSRDEKAHEECLRHGACMPFEKEYSRKDGARIPVLLATAVTNLSPFRWITFIQELTGRAQLETAAGSDDGHDFEEIVGQSGAMRRVLGQVKVVAPTDATVLLLGETGTGKELLARAVHRISGRHNHPFITLNCAAIPTGLLESELFGYEKGAFTGALSKKVGRFEMAHQGTLFLDEVGDIPLELQPKLLRALQEKEFERLGGVRTIPIDVRLIAATNRNLKQMMGDRLFRSDLYYRLRVFPITIPPLRDRPEDIPVLARHFTHACAREMNKEIVNIPSETMRALESWSWPGNVRELQNFIERAVILSPGPTLRAPLAEIRMDVRENFGNLTLQEMEREYIIRVLHDTGGVVTMAARHLGIPRTTLNALMRKLGISRRDF